MEFFRQLVLSVIAFLSLIFGSGDATLMSPTEQTTSVQREEMYPQEEPIVDSQTLDQDTDVHREAYFESETNQEEPDSNTVDEKRPSTDATPEDAHTVNWDIQVEPSIESVVEESTSDAAVSLDDASAKARAALVNITCDSTHPVVGSMTGSGVIIDPKGIIVTNAHVAQFFLIEKQTYGTDCIVRMGSPAAPAYDAELIFLSPQWIGRNGSSLGQFIHGVNGDYDYAFLAITKSLNGSPLPSSFPYVAFGSEQAYTNEQVVLAGYAAELLTQSQIDTTLYPTLAASSVKSVESFTGSRADILNLGKGAAAQRGSSGGGIVSANGTLLGVMTIGHTNEDSELLDLSGISVDYIRRMYEREEGKSLDLLLSTPTNSSIAAFEWRIADLAKPLISNLSNADIYQWWYGKI